MDQARELLDVYYADIPLYASTELALAAHPLTVPDESKPNLPLDLPSPPMPNPPANGWFTRNVLGRWSA